MCETCSELTIKTIEQLCSKLRINNIIDDVNGIFKVNFEHISHLFLVFLVLTLSECLFGGLFDKVLQANEKLQNP